MNVAGFSGRLDAALALAALVFLLFFVVTVPHLSAAELVGLGIPANIAVAMAADVSV